MTTETKQEYKRLSKNDYARFAVEYKQHKFNQMLNQSSGPIAGETQTSQATTLLGKRTREQMK